MPGRIDVLDEQDSLRAPFIQSVLLHGAVFGLLVVSTISFSHRVGDWGGPTHAGDSVSVTPVKSIPLPSRSGHVNPVANDTESQVPQAPKPEQKKQVKVPEKAIPIKGHTAKEQVKPQSSQRYRSEPIKPNQVFSHEAPAAVSPMFQTQGGAVGLGQNNTLGTQFGAYADLIAQRVTDKWQTSGLAGLSAPIVIVTFDIQRDGSIRNAKLAQRSGNSTLDYSALRAVNDAAPFPPLPPGYDRNQASIELQFQLQK
jgi:TonB family protein